MHDDIYHDELDPAAVGLGVIFALLLIFAIVRLL